MTGGRSGHEAAATRSLLFSKFRRGPTARLLMGLSAILLVGTLLLAWRIVGTTGNPLPIQAHEAQLNQLHAACNSEMVANTCQVMGLATVQLVSDSPPVFVAGVGAIAAADYQAMYEAGDAMCSVVRTACAADWDAARCQTARKLWLR